MPRVDSARLVATWSRRDLAHALLPTDRGIIGGSAALRALIIDFVLADGTDDELFDAWAMLGRLLAQHGASPTLASATVDGCVEAVGGRAAAWIASARAALAEGFASALVDSAHQAAMQAWEFPSCAVRLGEAGLAVAAGHPSDDDEVLAAWSARVAKQAALRGVRRAIVSGGDRPCAALIDAMQVVGIDVHRV